MSHGRLESKRALSTRVENNTNNRLVLVVPYNSKKYIEQFSEALFFPTLKVPSECAYVRECVHELSVSD